MPKHKVRKRLPVAYSTEIGRIISHWAYLEWRLKNVTFALLDVGPKVGRLAIREPRASDYIGMFIDLMAVKGIEVSTDLKALKKLLAGLKEKHSAPDQPRVRKPVELPNTQQRRATSSCAGRVLDNRLGRPTWTQRIGHLQHRIAGAVDLEY